MVCHIQGKNTGQVFSTVRCDYALNTTGPFILQQRFIQSDPVSEKIYADMHKGDHCNIGKMLIDITCASLEFVNKCVLSASNIGSVQTLESFAQLVFR